MGNLRDENKLRQMQPDDVVLGADKDGCLVNFPPDNFSGSIPISIDTETGDGEELFTEPEVNSFLFKKLKSKDGSTDVITDTDGNIDLSVNFPPFPEIPTVDYPVIDGQTSGAGIPIYKGLTGKKINIASLYSDDFIITDFEGGIKINSPGGGSNSYDWYIDAGYIRPSNWDTPKNPKEHITYLNTMTEIDPTVYTHGQVVAVANGTLNDPFKSYEEYLLKRIYGTQGVNTTVRPGPYSKVYPAHISMTIRITNNVETSSHIEVQNTTLRLDNGAILTYAGNRLYAIDYAELYDMTPVDGTGKSLYIMGHTIAGEGVITRTNGFGLVRVKYDSVKTEGKGGGLYLIGYGEGGLQFSEGYNLGLYERGKDENDDDLWNGASPVYVGNVAPVTPLIEISGSPYKWWGAAIYGSKVFIRTKSQVGIQLSNNGSHVGSLTTSAEALMYQVENSYIGYQKRLLRGDPSLTTDEIAILDNYYTDVFYMPYEGYSMFKADDGCQFRFENLATESNGFYRAKASSLFDLSNGAQVYHVTNIKETGGGGFLNFIRARGTGNLITIQNANLLAVRYFNIFKGDGSNNVSASLVNTIIGAQNIKSDVGNLSITTGRTLTILNGLPIIEVLPFASNNTDARDVRNYPVGTLFQSGDGVVRQVFP